MNFSKILPYLNEGARFAIAEWPADTFIAKSAEGYIAFTFKNNLQEARWTPTRYDAVDAVWKTYRDVPLPTLKQEQRNPTLFRLLDDTGVEQAHRENITGTVDVAYYDERNKLKFENIIEGSVVPCEPGLEMFLYDDWFIKASSDDIQHALERAGQALEQPSSLTPPPHQVAEQPTPVGEQTLEVRETSVEVRTNAVSFAPEHSSEEEPGLRVRPGVYTAQGVMQQLLVEVHSTSDNIVYLTPYPTVNGAAQEVISATLFEAMFAQLPRLTKGVTLRHKERGAHITVQDFDESSVMVSIDLGYDTGNAVIPRDRFQSDEWEFVSYQPEAPEPDTESNTAPGAAAEQTA